MENQIELIAPYDFYGHEAYYLSQNSPNDVWIRLNDRRVKSKSLYGILSLGIRSGDKFILSSDNEDKLEQTKKLIEHTIKER